MVFNKHLRLTPISSVLLFCLISGIVAQNTENFKCPHEYGFYPHRLSCDKYWKCENNAGELKTCGNGLAFDSSDPKYLTENCDYLHNVDCGERTELQPPVGVPNCPRLYGIFPDEQRCDTFWSCWNGEANKYTCAPGLAYDSEARVCMWADQVPECKVLETPGGFKCPPAADNPNPGTFSRHAHPEDCRKYYVCLEGNPREYGCPIGTVYKIGDDDYSGQCQDPEGVDGCENYYGDELKNIKKSELLLGLGGSGSDFSVTQKPRPRVKGPSTPKKVIPAPTQTSASNKGQNTRTRPQSQPLIRESVQQTVKEQAPSTTEAPKSSNDDYYYYDDQYETPQQQNQQQQQQQKSN